MSENEVGSFNDLFADTEPEAVESDTEETVEETEESETPPEGEAPIGDKPEEASGTVSEDQATPILAKIEIDGQSFDLGQDDVQKIAEEYVTVRRENERLKGSYDVVQSALELIGNIKSGVDVEDSFKALGLDYDEFITERVKDFIRRSTLSKQERELEDIRKEKEKLHKQLTARQQAEEEKQAAEMGRSQAQQVLQTVQESMASVPEALRAEVTREVLYEIEKRVRAGGPRPSVSGIKNAVAKIAARKQAVYAPPAPPKKLAPRVLSNNPTPSTKPQKTAYNATDYNNLFK